MTKVEMNFDSLPSPVIQLPNTNELGTSRPTDPPRRLAYANRHSTSSPHSLMQSDAASSLGSPIGIGGKAEGLTAKLLRSSSTINY